MKFVAATDVGNVRTNNEDSYYIPENNKNLFILADGMGGHLAGETASSLAISEISKYINNEEIENEEDVELAMIKAIEIANKKIFSLSEDNIEYRGMGTTVSICYIFNDKLIYTNIGDSRIYEIDDGEISQLTKDDSFVNYLIEIGEITEEQAQIHPKKNVLTKALGTSENIRMKVEYKNLKKGVKFLLCSDGLTNMVDIDRIKDIVNENPIDIAKDILVKEALENGGVDNITLILIDNE